MLLRAIVAAGDDRPTVQKRLNLSSGGLSLLLSAKRGAGRDVSVAALDQYGVTQDAWSIDATPAERFEWLEALRSLPRPHRRPDSDRPEAV